MVQLRLAEVLVAIAVDLFRRSVAGKRNLVAPDLDDRPVSKMEIVDPAALGAHKLVVFDDGRA